MKSLLRLSIKDPVKWDPSFSRDDLMYFPIILLKASGMNHIKFEDYLPKRLYFVSSILNWLYSTFLSICLLHLVYLYYQEINSDSGLVRVTNAITMIIINLFGFFTLLFFKVNTEKFQRLVDFMNKNFLERSAFGLTFMTSERSYRVACRHTFRWTYMCVVGTLQWYIVPCFTKSRTLPIDVKYPFDALIDPYYQFFYFVHIVCQVEIGIIYSNAMMTLANVVIILNGQFDMLFCSLKNVRATAMTLNGCRLKELKELQANVELESEELNQYYLGAEIFDDVKANTMQIRDKLKRRTNKTVPVRKLLPQDDYLTDLQEELDGALLNAIRHHEMLIDFAKILEDFFNMFVFLKSFQTTLQIGVLLYTFFKINASVVVYIKLVSYVILTGLDVFQLGYFGETFKSQTLRIGDALLRSPWHLCGGPFRRNALIILANTIQPLVMTGGKFFVMDFHKLTSILKGSFSYFTLLQNLGK